MNNFVRDCHKLEMLASKIYHVLSRKETFPKELRDAFAQLSVDEKNHSNNLDLILQASKAELGDYCFRVSWEKIYEALNFAEKFLKMVEQSDINEVTALSVAMDMENLFIKAHAHNVLEFQNLKLAALFEELGRQDQAHFDTLKKVLVWWKRRPEIAGQD